MLEDTTTIDDLGVEVMTRGGFFEQICDSANSNHISDGLEIACRFINSSAYLLVRDDGSEDFVISSNWPYDLAKELGQAVVSERPDVMEGLPSRSAFEPSFLDAGDLFRIPKHFAKQICVLPVTCGEQKFIILFLFEPGTSIAQERLRDAALACSYHIAEFVLSKTADNNQAELTDREMECLSWIAKGKTSDEIALIIGISRNTVNNYITSIMNKTATKSRAEAVAEAVRGQLI
ncbi:MAG: helix-turn-helix transcriptional regulator [Rhizobiaceae bacterium]|nr:helix-turn-helix transcriptional regulator [Rhizobiaceae bacterium]